MKSVSVQKLQAIFDMNGLDTFNAQSEYLTVKGNRVLIDAKLYEYCRPYSEDIINHIEIL